MNDKSPLDLTGQWHGTYAYPEGAGPATPFLANLTETGGSLTGSIIEPDAIYQQSNALEALVAGARAERSVDFTKTYRGQHVGYENPVDYVGQLSPDGQAITGMWSIYEMNGTFEMFREIALEEPVEAEVEEEVPLSR